MQPSGIRFTDITATSGIGFRHHTGGSGQRYYVEPHSGGAAMLDYDRDGNLDLYFVDGGPLPGSSVKRRQGNRLYRGRGDGTFEDVTSRAGVQGTAYGMGAYAADYDGDDDVDLLVTQFNAPSLLYRNRGDGRFEEVSQAAGLRTAGWATGAAWFDADRDGDLDLYVVRYLAFSPASHRRCYYKGHHYNCSPYDYESLSDVFFRNQGRGRFEEQTRAAGMLDPEAKGLGAIATDVDDDGWQDLYVANDETPNLLYRNQEGRTFSEEGLLSGVAVNASGATQAGMGLDLADVDGDGDQDLACTNFQGEPNNLYIRKGPARFVDEAAVRGWDAVSRDLLCFAVLLDDFDLDGDADAFIACGHVWENVPHILPGVGYAQRNLLLVNDGRGHFSDGGEAAGAAFLRDEVSRAAVAGDLDNDGDIDLAYLNLDAPPVVLRNDSEPRGHWLRVRLKGPRHNTAGQGALVTVEAGGRKQSRELRTVRGFFSSSPATITFGLGATAAVDKVTVSWRDGSADSVVQAPAVDQELLVRHSAP